MKLFIDDVRECPKGWEVARSPAEAISKIIHHGRELTAISFDFDMGDDFLSGLDVARVFIALQVFAADQSIDITVHSSNPSGRDQIIHVLNEARRQGSLPQEVTITLGHPTLGEMKPWS